MRFEYQPSGDNASKYEYVELLKNTPRNTSDYDDLQLIVRHRIASLIKELFGNCRISPQLGEGATSFKIPLAYQSNKTHLAFTGTWYVDGYRVELDEVNSIEYLDPATSYSVFLLLSFYEETLDDYKGCAIYDAGTKKYIQTSTRVKINPKIGISTGDTYTAEGQYIYKIGTALWNAADENWDFEDAVEFPYIRNKYTEAMDIVANAVHKESLDNKTVEIKRLVTDKNDEKARIYVEEIDENKIRIGFETESGNLFSAYEMVKENGEWMPILWMQPGNLSGYPVSYFTPEGFKIYDNRGSVGQYSNNSISIGDGRNSLNIDRDELKFRTGNVDGLSVKRYSSSSAVHKPAVTRDAANTAATLDATYGNGSLIRTNNTGNGKSAVYTLSMPSAQFPTDQILKLNHKVIFNSGSYTDSVVTATVEVSDDNSLWEPVQNQNWILKPGNSVISNPFEFSIQTSGKLLDNADTLYVKITYSIRTLEASSSDVEAKVGLLTSSPVESEVYSGVHPVSEMHAAKINSCVLWVDSDNKLRIKKVSASTIGADIQALMNTAAGSTVDAPGGMAVASQTAIEDIQLAASSSGSDVVDGPQFDPDTKTLIIPVVNAAATNDHAKNGGLMTNSQYQILYNALTAINAGKNPLPENVILVSPSWKTTEGEELTLSYPYTTSLTTALQWAQEKTFTQTPLILLYPGNYVGNFSLVASASYPGNPVSIVAVDPKFTSITGSITDGQKKLSAYIDVPVNASGGIAVDISKESIITFGKNAAITGGSSQTTELIRVLSNARLTFFGDVIHNGTVCDSVIKMGSYGNYTPNLTFYGTVYGLSTKKVFNIYSGYLTTYGTLSSNAKSTTVGNGVISITGDSDSCVHSSKIHGEIITDGIPAVYINATWTYKPEVELFGAVYCNNNTQQHVDIAYAIHATGGKVHVHKPVKNDANGRAIEVGTDGEVYVRHTNLKATTEGVYVAADATLCVLDHATINSVNASVVKAGAETTVNAGSQPVYMYFTIYNHPVQGLAFTTEDQIINQVRTIY